MMFNIWSYGYVIVLVTLYSATLSEIIYCPNLFSGGKLTYRSYINEKMFIIDVPLPIASPSSIPRDDRYLP